MRPRSQMDLAEELIGIDIAVYQEPKDCLAIKSEELSSLYFLPRSLVGLFEFIRLNRPFF